MEKGNYWGPAPEVKALDKMFTLTIPTLGDASTLKKEKKEVEAVARAIGHLLRENNLVTKVQVSEGLAAGGLGWMIVARFTDNERDIRSIVAETIKQMKPALCQLPLLQEGFSKKGFEGGDGAAFMFTDGTDMVCVGAFAENDFIVPAYSVEEAIDMAEGDPYEMISGARHVSFWKHGMTPGAA